MSNKILLYNTLTRKKDPFIPINHPNVGMYVCGPTVYGDPHLGHARPAITFDVLYRYLHHLGYKVRYVRNITDVGHLENDQDEGEDKIAKKARMEQIEPMEVAQYYTDRYHHYMNKLNVQQPSIEPRASGHIIEQISMIERILTNGFAYVSNGSVYFDVPKYNEKFNYGKLSGRVLEDLQENTRKLEGQDEKRSAFDFALWKKASPEHIMKWTSPWSEGFPGWHLECSAMGMKYLGERFDIHGGGMDLMFPHHECEIAQSQASNGVEAVNFWVHNNLITINGQKMGKSLGNFITIEEFFAGSHKLLERSYDPMTIRFFILMAHYRSTIDFSNEALIAAEKGLDRLFAGMDTLDKLSPGEKSGFDFAELKGKCYAAMNDDMNTSILISHLFDGVRQINSIKDGKLEISSDDLTAMKALFATFAFDILGLLKEEVKSSEESAFGDVVNLVLSIRQDAKANKDWATADKIRIRMQELGFTIKDNKDGFEWTLQS